MFKSPTSEISNDEKVGRAILSHFYDPNTKKLSKSAMWSKNGTTSISRFQVLAIEDIRHIWLGSLHNPPEKHLIGVAIFSKDELQNVIGKSENHQGTILEFVPDPCNVEDKCRITPDEDNLVGCNYNLEQKHCPLNSKQCEQPCVRNCSHGLITSKISGGLARLLTNHLETQELIHSF